MNRSKEGFFGHVVDNFSRRVEGAGGLAGDRAGLRVDGGEKVFKGASEQLGVEGDVLFKRSVFFDGEFVVAEDVEEAASFRGR